MKSFVFPLVMTLLARGEGMYAWIAKVFKFGRTPRRTNRPESGPSLREVI